MVETQANVATFEASGISISLPQGWYFHDEKASKLDPFVPLSKGAQSIEGRSLEILVRHLIRYNISILGMNPETAEQDAKRIALRQHLPIMMMQATGYSTSSGKFMLYGPVDFGCGNETHLHILYLDEGRADINLRLRAHEEQHAINHIPGGIDMLERKIAEDKGTPIHFGRIEDKELAADCNAVHALVQSGFDPEKAYEYDSKKDPNVARRFRRAMYIYETGDYGFLTFTGKRISSAIKSLIKK